MPSCVLPLDEQFRIFLHSIFHGKMDTKMGNIWTFFSWMSNCMAKRIIIWAISGSLSEGSGHPETLESQDFHTFWKSNFVETVCFDGVLCNTDLLKIHDLKSSEMLFWISIKPKSISHLFETLIGFPKLSFCNYTTHWPRFLWINATPAKLMPSWVLPLEEPFCVFFRIQFFMAKRMIIWAISESLSEGSAHPETLKSQDLHSIFHDKMDTKMGNI